MTIYEQVQQAVDFIEDHLGEKLPARRVAEAAYMSLRSLHNHFPAVTGSLCGEYVIRRRLAEAALRLLRTDHTVLDVALDSGYESHEAFTRAFGKEFGISPSRYRSGSEDCVGLERLVLVREMYMGVLIRKLDDCGIVMFDGFQPDPEAKATEAMEKWLAVNRDALGPHRIFGHNIDSRGNPAGENYQGYRLMVTLPESFGDSGGADSEGPTAGILTGGRFVVTGIEGSFSDDPEGRWIGEGWARLVDMMKARGMKPHSSGRWFEEHLEPVTPGRMRLDLYLEVE